MDYLGGTEVLTGALKRRSRRGVTEIESSMGIQCAVAGLEMEAAVVRETGTSVRQRPTTNMCLEAASSMQPPERNPAQSVP